MVETDKAFGSALSRDRLQPSLSLAECGGNCNADSSHEIQVEDLAAIIKTLKLGPAHIVGHSYGGAVALHLALRYPELVRTLVLAEPGVVGVLRNTRRGPRGKQATKYGLAERTNEALSEGEPEQTVRAYAAVVAPGVYEKVGRG